MDILYYAKIHKISKVEWMDSLLVTMFGEWKLYLDSISLVYKHEYYRGRIYLHFLRVTKKQF